MPASSSVSVQSVIDWCEPFVDNVPLRRNGTTEPALSIANIVIQIMLQPPFRWRWNRSITGFYCQPGVQDYLLGNWGAGITLPVGFRVIDTNSNSQRVTTKGVTGSDQPAWNTSPNGATADNTVAWVNDGPIPNGSDTYSFYWIENCTANDINSTNQKWYSVAPKIDLELSAAQSRPMNIAAELDDGQGNLTFRLMPPPDAAYPIVLTLQEKPIVITKLSQTFEPIPDEYLMLVRWGFLAWANYYLGRLADFQTANAKFVAGLLAAQTALTQTEKDAFMKAYDSYTASQMFLTNLQQGQMARGV